jgi:hypothetical protein
MTAIRCDALVRASRHHRGRRRRPRDRRREIYGFLGRTGPASRPRCGCCAPSRSQRGRASVAGFDVVESPGEVRLRIGVALQGSGAPVRRPAPSC